MSTNVERLILAVLMVILAGAISLNRWAYSVDQAIYDASIAQFRKPIDKDILVVAIDERSLLELGRWPWPRNLHAQLVDRLREAGVKAIAFDVVFAEPDRIHPEYDKQFAAAIKRMGNVVLVVHMEQTHAGGQILEVLPDPQLFAAAATAGHIHVEYDVDGVSRAVFLKEGLGEAYWPHSMYALWEMTGKNPEEKIPGLRQTQGQVASPFVIQRDFYNLIPLADPTSKTSTVSYTDVIHNRIAARNLAGKIAIVGATAKGSGDIVATSVGPMNGVEFNANVFNSIRNGTTIVPVSMPVHAIVSMLAVFIIIMLGVRASPRQYLFLTLSAVVLVLVIAVVSLASIRLWFAPLSIVIPLLIFYPLWSWRRLEQALRFLRRELARVELQTSPNPQWNIEELKQKLHFLSELTAVSDWHLIEKKSNQTLAGTAIPLPANTETMALELVDERGVIPGLLQWQKSAEPIEQALWRNALSSLALRSGAVEKQVPSELVSETIARLRDANREIDESRAFFDQCLENLQDAVLVADLFGEVTFANVRARSLFHLQDKNNIQLMPCLHQLEIEGGWQPVINRLVREPSEVYAEVKGAGENQVFFLQLAGLTWRTSELDTLIFSFTDISIVKESERARTEALHFLSHDLRSPVVSILALLEHYRNGNRQQLTTDPQLRDVLSEIEDYARKNLSFAESFLQLARAEIVGDSKFDLCDIHSVVDNALMMTRQQAVAKQIEVHLDRSREDMWVWGDGDLLERVVINLLTNAIKYSHSNTEIRLAVHTNDDQVVIKVADQGIGIGADELDNIFRKFHRTAGAKPISGAGLGLHFVDTVCKKHNGTIDVTSEMGVGSTFTVKLPLCDSLFDV